MQMPERMGQILGDYRLIKSIGKGGYAEVYLAEHTTIGGVQVAIKVLKERELQDDERNGFHNEAKIMMSLIHDHIVKIRDYGIEMNKYGSDISTPYIVMEYLPLGTLRRRHPAGTRVPFPQIALYIKQIAEALQYAHDQKPESIVHRDIKPENMLLKRDDFVVLSDFGIAIQGMNTGNVNLQKAWMNQRTGPAEIMLVPGTMAYTAPERLRGGTTQRTSDQYSLAIVAYEWLCGKRPFYGSDEEISQKHMHEEPPSLVRIYPPISPAIEQVVMKGLAKKPEDRYKSVLQFALALEEAIQLSTGPAQINSFNSFTRADEVTPIIGIPISPPTSVISREKSGLIPQTPAPLDANTPPRKISSTPPWKISASEEQTQDESVMRRPSQPPPGLSTPPSRSGNQGTTQFLSNEYRIPMSPPNVDPRSAETQSSSMPPRNGSTSERGAQQWASQYPNSPLGDPTLPSGNPSSSGVQRGGQVPPISPVGNPSWYGAPSGAMQPPLYNNQYAHMPAGSPGNQNSIPTQPATGLWNGQPMPMPSVEDKRTPLQRLWNYFFETDPFFLKKPINRWFLPLGYTLNGLSVVAALFVLPFPVNVIMAVIGAIVTVMMLRLCALLVSKYTAGVCALFIAVWWSFVANNAAQYLPYRNLPLYNTVYLNREFYALGAALLVSLLIHVWYINNRLK